MKNRLQTLLLLVMLTFGDILWISAFFGVLGLGPNMINADGDLGRHITVGNYILNSGVIPLRDDAYRRVPFHYDKGAHLRFLKLL